MAARPPGARSTPPSEYLHGPGMVYIAGAPGAGKGTLCAKLAHDMSKTGICLYLSVGEHLRALCTPEKHLLNKRFRGVLSYDELKQYVDSRELVPALNMGHIVNAWYEMYRPAPNVKVLADGFPRDLETAKIADRQFGPPHRILFIHCPEDIARQRFLELRRSADDPDAVFSKRYDEFAIQNGAIVEHYQDSKLIKTDTSGETEKSYRLLQQEMQKMRWQPESSGPLELAGSQESYVHES